MQLSSLFWILSSVLIGVISTIAFIDKKQINNASDYLLHSQNLKLKQLVSTLVAANLSLGNMIFVCAIFGYAYSWSGVFWMGATIVALTIGFLCFARPFKTYIQSRDNYGSIHDYIACSHAPADESARAQIRKTAAIISCLSLFIAIVIEVHLAAAFIYTLTGLTSIYIVSALMIFVGVFSTVGGFRSVVITDIIQGFLLLLTIVAGATFFYSIGTRDVFSGLESNPALLLTGTGPFAPIGFIVLGAGWLLTTPDTWQRNCCARRYDTSMRGAAIGGFLMLVAVLCFSIAGLIVKHNMEPLLIQNDQYSKGEFPVTDIFLYSTNNITQRLLLAIVATGLLMAAISTINTFLVVISHAVGVDFSPAMRRLRHIPTEEPASQELIARARLIMLLTSFMVVLVWALTHEQFIHKPVNIFFVTYSVQFSLLTAVLAAGIPSLRNVLAARSSIISSAIVTVVVGSIALLNSNDSLLGLSGDDWLSVLPAITVIFGVLGYIVGYLISDEPAAEELSSG